MLVDFPDFSHANPWQLKTIQTSASMEVKRTNTLESTDCYALHISWEDSLLMGCDTIEKANHRVAQVEEYLRAQSLRSKIIWTLHNLTSHKYPLKGAEEKLRSVIVEYASTINLMSLKHAFLIPEKHQAKINIVPHYIEPSRFAEVKKNTDLTYFRYGIDRGRTDTYFYRKLLNDHRIKKFVSDSGLHEEVDRNNTVLTKRRFTFLEADIYAQLSNFSTYYQKPQFNSGVLNFLIGNNIAILHDSNSIRYMDLPESFSKFRIDLHTLNNTNITDLQSLISIDDDFEEFISFRSPKNVSEAFWKGVES